MKFKNRFSSDKYFFSSKMLSGLSEDKEMFSIVVFLVSIHSDKVATSFVLNSSLIMSTIAIWMFTLIMKPIAKPKNVKYQRTVLALMPFVLSISISKTLKLNSKFLAKMKISLSICWHRSLGWKPRLTEAALVENIWFLISLFRNVDQTIWAQMFAESLQGSLRAVTLLLRLESVYYLFT